MLMTRLAKTEKKVLENTDRVNNLGGAVMKRFDVTTEQLVKLHEIVNDVL